ncbi:hypothetical protein BBM16_09310 [Vibrio parahaemolyticus]|nr:hypothetical protein BBM16_09310 [Vibrio parahaemolyticus]
MKNLGGAKRSAQANALSITHTIEIFDLMGTCLARERLLSPWPPPCKASYFLSRNSTYLICQLDIAELQWHSEFGHLIRGVKIHFIA